MSLLKLKDFIKSPILLGLFSFALIIISNSMLAQHDRKSQDLNFSPPPEIEHLHFGYREVLADAFWLRVIQDNDYCEAHEAEKVCKGNGWVSKVVYAISLLSPHYRLPVYVGALSLSIIVKDQPGASKIFDRAVELFPEDWPILYAAAYQAMIEEKNKEKAGHLLERAGKYGAPDWVFALATKMYTEAGQHELGERLYESLKASGISEEVLIQVRKRLKNE